MNKPLLYFSYLIIVANFLIFVVGISANIGFVGAFMGGLMAIGTDPIILMLGTLLGAGLVVKSFKLSVVYLWLGAMFLTMLVHVILGTTKVFVDVVRFDAFLITSALIIIVTSFFVPKSKAITKKTSVKKVKVKHGAKVNKDSNKGIRSILLIIIISVSTFLLVTPSPRESLVGENVTQYVLKPFFTSSRILKCTYRELTTGNKILVSLCYTIDVDEFIVKWNILLAKFNDPNKLEKAQVDKWVSNQTMLLPDPPLRIDPEASVKKLGAFYFKKKYSTDKNTVTKTINILHPILLIILIFYTWRLRFCITVVTISLFKKIKAAI